MDINKMLADLSGRSADFVSALNKARDAEAKKELGYSLTWYVNAQNFYPASIIANIRNGKVIGFTIDKPGSGYSSPPEIFSDGS